jgi:hypothetical protein
MSESETCQSNFPLSALHASHVTYLVSYPCEKRTPAQYLTYGEIYGGTPKQAGSSTYPSKIRAFIAVDLSLRRKTL